MEYYDKQYDRVTTKNEKRMKRIDRVFHKVTTTDDPIIRQVPAIFFFYQTCFIWLQDLKCCSTKFDMINPIVIFWCPEWILCTLFASLPSPVVMCLPLMLSWPHWCAALDLFTPGTSLCSEWVTSCSLTSETTPSLTCFRLVRRPQSLPKMKATASTRLGTLH